MKSIHVLAVFLVLMAGGCASTGSDSAHVLSGEAPVDKIVGQADSAAAAGDHHAASLLYQQALRQQPHAEVWFRLGLAFKGLNEPDRAVWAFRNALALDPDHAESLQAVGFYLTTRDRPDEAAPYLERLLEQQPDNWRVHNALGVVADLQGRFDVASGHYANAIDLNPSSPMLWNNMGYSHYMAGDYRMAVQHIGRALRLDPAHKGARHNLALVLARQANYEEALQIMLSAGGDKAEAYCDVGYLAFKMGDYRIAEDMLMEAIRRSGTYYRQAHQNLAAVRHAMAANREG